ncbi:Gfo/Idh/MocA family protein [Aquihabitans daechungensis]|uniref:Gfo/Idh/MocA family protein n=1 Tax=Aquihabitans daechungensis TaxID=1052257 RepID=UPI003BA00297
MSTGAPRPVCVVVGSGSAGRRHAAALRALLPDHRLVVVRRAASLQPVEQLRELGAELVATVDEAAALAPVLAIVAGPATSHARDAVAMLEAGASVLVEKPLAATAEDGRTLATAEVAAGRPVVLGYHLRFDDVASRFTELVHQRIPHAGSFELRVGQYLGSWRPFLPVEGSVSARQELGGGVLLELSHELDVVLDAFGPVASVRAELRRDGAPTDGLVDTVAELELVMASGATGRVHLDMVSDPPFRTWRAEGGGVRIEADLLAGSIRAEGGGDPVDEQVPPGWRERAEDRLVRHALAVAEGRALPVCGVEDGVAVLEVVEAARTSAARGDVVDVDRAAHAADGAA